MTTPLGVGCHSRSRQVHALAYAGGGVTGFGGGGVLSPSVLFVLLLKIKNNSPSLQHRRHMAIVCRDNLCQPDTCEHR